MSFLGEFLEKLQGRIGFLIVKGCEWVVKDYGGLLQLVERIYKRKPCRKVKEVSCATAVGLDALGGCALLLCNAKVGVLQ